MNLSQFVVGCGVVLSFWLLAILVSCWPGSRRASGLSMRGIRGIPKRRADRVAAPERLVRVAR